MNYSWDRIPSIPNATHDGVPAMDPRLNAPADEPSCPPAFVILATFASGLIWLLAILGYLPLQ